MVEHVVRIELAGLHAQARLEAHALGEEVPPGSLGAEKGAQGAGRGLAVEQRALTGEARSLDDGEAGGLGVVHRLDERELVGG